MQKCVWSSVGKKSYEAVSQFIKQFKNILTEALRQGPVLTLNSFEPRTLYKILLDDIFRFLSLLQVQARFALGALWLGANAEADSLNTSHIWLHCLSIPLSSVVPDGAV